MRRTTMIAATLSASAALLGSVAAAGDFVNQVFESGSLSGVDNSTQNVAATSAPNQWHLWSVSGTNRAKIAATGRTFQTGTNSEALFITPGLPGATQNDTEGAVYHASTPFTIAPGQIVYTVAETFSDVFSFGNQFLKVNVRFGMTGNTADYAGYDNATDEWSVDSNFNTFHTDNNLQGRATIGPQNAELPDSKYDGTASKTTPTLLDRSFLLSTVFRPMSGGTNAESQGLDAVDPARTVEGFTAADGSRVIKTLPTMATSFDRITIHFRRHFGFYDGLNVGQADELLNSWTGDDGLSSSIIEDENGVITNPLDIKLGIKSVRIGATWDTDVNLDGVVNNADKAIVTANQFLTDATLFEGDVTNDGFVDMADLDLYNTLLGDYDLDGNVDGDDFNVWQRQAGSSVAAGTGADGDRSGLVDGNDLNVWRSQFGQTSSMAITAVPEPTGLALAALTLLIGSMKSRRSVSARA